MDKDQRATLLEVSVAGGLWCVFSQPIVAEVQKYIERQEEHHRRKTFQDEFRAFLKKYEIEYNESYVWD
jgi:hypothetical protein